MVFGVNKFDLDFGSNLILSNSQSRATLWVLDTVSHRRTSSFTNGFDYGFVVIRSVQLRPFPFHIRSLGFGMKSRTSFLNACMFGLDVVVG